MLNNYRQALPTGRPNAERPSTFAMVTVFDRRAFRTAMSMSMPCAPLPPVCKPCLWDRPWNCSTLFPGVRKRSFLSLIWRRTYPPAVPDEMQICISSESEVLADQWPLRFYIQASMRLRRPTEAVRASRRAQGMCLWATGVPWMCWPARSLRLRDRPGGRSAEPYWCSATGLMAGRFPVNLLARVSNEPFR